MIVQQMKGSGELTWTWGSLSDTLQNPAWQSFWHLLTQFTPILLSWGVEACVLASSLFSTSIKFCPKGFSWSDFITGWKLITDSGKFYATPKKSGEGKSFPQTSHASLGSYSPYNRNKKKASRFLLKLSSDVTTLQLRLMNVHQFYYNTFNSTSTAVFCVLLIIPARL